MREKGHGRYPCIRLMHILPLQDAKFELDSEQNSLIRVTNHEVLPLFEFLRSFFLSRKVNFPKDTLIYSNYLDWCFCTKISSLYIV